ncbi:MAG: hypothetical protein KAH77_10195 [Thiomargarita sp.]|nr:hypothetical protein [Thiomargarita sp.]
MAITHFKSILQGKNVTTLPTKQSTGIAHADKIVGTSENGRLHHSLLPNQFFTVNSTTTIELWNSYINEALVRITLSVTEPPLIGDQFNIWNTGSEKIDIDANGQLFTCLKSNQYIFTFLPTGWTVITHGIETITDGALVFSNPNAAAYFPLFF